jgi:lipopolysaccharide export system permease protein
MKLLEQHIAKSVSLAIAMVAFLLSGLQIFILFIKQIEDIGREGFSILEATLYVCLQMPHQVYHFFPIVSLLGVLIGLGVLANNNELVVVRASGMSILQIAKAILKAAFVVIVLMTALGETIIPKMAYYSNDRKAQAVNGGQTLRTANGVWTRSLNDFIFIGQITSDSSLSNVFQFHFSPAHQLLSASKIQTIQYEKDHWEIINSEQTTFVGLTTKQTKVARARWGVSVNPASLQMSSVSPDEMSLFELHQYLREKKKNHQTAVSYQLVYFQRLLQPFSTVVMMMLAIPFIFGPLRSSTMGSKILMGVTVGFSFYILSQLFNLVGQIYQIPPIFAVPIPILLFAGVGLYLMRRVN